ncbi:MAG: hypothetical protein JWS08_09185 [Phormidium sp. PBR-2020]|nr:MAG: hypothetical protein JWS08_09185 [Phormidium sp. PBR-2020]
MKLLRPQLWLNFLALLPGTVLTVLTIAVAFLRFYDEQDFSLLGYVSQPRAWSNRFTLAALLVAVVNFGVEWNRRNRETDRLAQAEQRKAEEEQRRAKEDRRRAKEDRRRAKEDRRRTEEAARAADERTAQDRRRTEEAARAENERAEERERAARRARIEARCRAAEIRFQLNPSLANRRVLEAMLAVLEEYGETL